MAAQLTSEDGIEVEKVRGGLGEFSVYFDDQKVIDTSRLWYPTTNKIVSKVRQLLSK